MIVVDTGFLILLVDPESTQNLDRAADRVRYFIDELSRTKEEVLIPAPSLAELVAGRVDRVEEIVETVRRLKTFSLQAFDPVTAIETGERIAAVLQSSQADPRPSGWKVAMKYDAMIAATAIVRGARAIYTTDLGFEKYLVGTSVNVVLVSQLPLPPEDPQGNLAI
jgi:predicted nucleic acid-binding protein